MARGVVTLREPGQSVGELVREGKIVCGDILEFVIGDALRRFVVEDASVDQGKARAAIREIMPHEAN